MKKKFCSAVVMLLAISLSVVSSFALGLPFADFQGAIQVDLDGNLPINNTVRITGYEANDGTYVTSGDSFIGQSLGASLWSGFSYDFTTDTLTIDPSASVDFYIGSSDGTDPYLTGVASNFSVNKLYPGIYTVNAYVTNQTYFHTTDSIFMEQYELACPDIGAQAEFLTWDIVFVQPTTSDYEYAINVSGKLAPVPEPATMLLFGTGLAGLAGVARRKKK